MIGRGSGLVPRTLGAPHATGASGLWTPARVANSSEWRRADLLVTTATGASAWGDILGHQPAATQAVGILQPIQTANQINGQTALVFTAASAMLLTVSGWTAPTTDAEGWIVCKSTTAGGCPWNFTSDSNNFYPFSSLVPGSQDCYLGFGSTARKTCGNAVVDITAYHVLSFQSAAGAWTVWQNGARLFTTATNTFAFVTTNNFGGGNSGGLTGASLGGGIAEDWIGRIMSSGDRASTKTYLNTRYGFVFSTAANNWS